MKKPEPQHILCEHEIVQIVPTHKWGGCLAVVELVRAWGCQAYVTFPSNDGEAIGTAYIRLAWTEFERIGAAVIFEPTP
jgi:hypothetical protein